MNPYYIVLLIVRERGLFICLSPSDVQTPPFMAFILLDLVYSCPLFFLVKR